jgi:hypothetical protein
MEDEIKKAVREVLLSEEFLAAFSKAFYDTPIADPIRSQEPTMSYAWEILADGSIDGAVDNLKTNLAVTESQED